MNLRTGIRPLRGVCLGLAASAAIGVLGCQSSVTMSANIPAQPTGARDPASYSATMERLAPSTDVDAGRTEADPITHQTTNTKGKGVYLQNCAVCHGEAGKPPAGSDVPDITDKVFTWDKSPQELFRDIWTSGPHQQVRSKLVLQDIWNSLYYAWTLHSDLNEVVQGGITFGRYCSVCHGTKGMGDGNLAENLNPRPRRFADFAWMVDKTDQRLYISISDGRTPSAMPAWKKLLTPTQRIQIVQYLRQFTYGYPENIQKKMAEQPPPE